MVRIPPPPNFLLIAAKSYIEQGLYIFPLFPKSKKPLTPNGFKDASNDIKVIERWWSENPQANIGIATGRISNFFVVDVDGEYPDDFPDLGLPTVKTPRGFHYYFEYPDDLEIKCRVKINGADVDVRSDGGYIVAPPSIHPDGGKYEFYTS